MPDDIAVTMPNGRTIDVPRKLAAFAYQHDVAEHNRHAWGPSDADLRAAVVRRYGEQIRSALQRAQAQMLQWSCSDSLAVGDRGVVRTIEPEAFCDVQAISRPLQQISGQCASNSATRRIRSQDRHDASVYPKLRCDVKGSVVIWLENTPLARLSAGAIQRDLVTRTHIVACGAKCNTIIAPGDGGQAVIIKRKTRRGKRGGRKHK